MDVTILQIQGLVQNLVLVLLGLLESWITCTLYCSWMQHTGTAATRLLMLLENPVLLSQHKACAQRQVIGPLTFPAHWIWACHSINMWETPLRGRWDVSNRPAVDWVGCPQFCLPEHQYKIVDMCVAVSVLISEPIQPCAEATTFAFQHL